MTDILNYWPIPEFKPRENQIKALKWMANLPNDVRYVFLQAPTGCGKSLIGATYSNYMHKEEPQNAFFLTPQRILQQQYVRTFKPDFATTLYGKSNYTCANKATTCDIGSLLKPRCKNCPYEQAKVTAKKTPNVILNYTNAFLAFKYTPIFHLSERQDIDSVGRPLMVLDECHSIESHLTELDALMITESRCKQYNVEFVSHQSISDAINWIGDTYLPAAVKYMNHLYGELQDVLDGITPTSDRHTKELKKLQSVQEHIELIDETLNQDPVYVKNNYVLIPDKTSIKFKRLTGDFAFQQYVDPMADRFLFMSSTILNYDGFCRDIGIDPEQAAYLDIESDFPIESRPIFFKPQMKMNYKWKNPENKKNRENLLDTLRKILDDHEDESGVIHTGNFAISEWLLNELQFHGTHQFFHHNPGYGHERNRIIDEFIKCDKPAVLLSPSVTEGLDLSEDLGRFAVFVKVPFPNLADAWIKRRMDLSNEWYQRQTLMNVIQGCGRVVRSKEDWGITYIVDSSFEFLYRMGGNMVPQWWKDAYRVIKG